MHSLSDRQRAELAGLMQQSLGDRLAGELSALDANLRALRPDLRWGRRRAGPGRPAAGLRRRGRRAGRDRRAGRPAGPARPGAPGGHPGRRGRRRGGPHAGPGRGRRRSPAARSGAGAAPAGLGQPGRGRADAEPEGAAPARRHRAAPGLRRPDRRAARPARPALGRGRRRGQRRVPALGVRRRAAVGRGPHADPGGQPGRADGAGAARGGRLRGGGDREAGLGGGGALRRPVVLDDLPGSLGADEADGAGAGAPDGDPVPAGRAADRRASAGRR